MTNIIHSDRAALGRTTTTFLLLDKLYMPRRNCPCNWPRGNERLGPVRQVMGQQTRVDFMSYVCDLLYDWIEDKVDDQASLMEHDWL